MKKIIVAVTLCVFGMITLAQTKKASPVKPKPKTAASSPLLKNSLDSFSYAVGLSMANFYKEQGVKNINTNIIIKALNDVKAGKPLLTDEQTNNCIVTFVQQAQGQKAAGNKKEGEEFLASNKKEQGVITLPSGMQYVVLKEGTGPKPSIDDTVKVHYQGSLIDGTVIDSSIKRGEPIAFALKGVIRGWTEALQLMPVGSKYRLFIPSHLAYGDNQHGPDIKPGSTLIFDVELLEIVKN